MLELTNVHLKGFEPGVTCRHRADPSSGRLLNSCFPRRGGIPELSFHYADTGRGTRMDGKFIISSETLERFLDLETATCCNKRADGWVYERMARGT